MEIRSMYLSSLIRDEYFIFFALNLLCLFIVLFIFVYHALVMIAGSKHFRFRAIKERSPSLLLRAKVLQRVGNLYALFCLISALIVACDALRSEVIHGNTYQSICGSMAQAILWLMPGLIFMFLGNFVYCLIAWFRVRKWY